MIAGKAVGPKPWESLGISKSTYYRKHGKGGGTEVSQGAGRRSSTQDAVERALAKQARIQLEQALGQKGPDEAVSFTATVELFRALVGVLRRAGS